MANDAMGPRFPASPASTASFGATLALTWAVLRTSWVAGTLLMKLDDRPKKSPEYGWSPRATGTVKGTKIDDRTKVNRVTAATKR